jgi:hypothetical protein
MWKLTLGYCILNMGTQIPGSKIICGAGRETIICFSEPKTAQR